MNTVILILILSSLIAIACSTSAIANNLSVLRKLLYIIYKYKKL